MSNQLNLLQMESNQVHRLTDDQWKKDTPDLNFECQLFSLIMVYM